MTLLTARLRIPQNPRSSRRARSVKIWLGGAIVGAYVLVAVFAPLLAPFDPLAQNASAALQGPSATHLLGTDELGRDVLSRLLHATRIDVPVAALVTLLPCLLGTLIGLVAGYFGGWFDAVVMRISDLLQAFPSYILMIVLVFAMGPGIPSLLISFTIIGWVVYARLVRTEVLRVREAGYVVAARTSGFSTLRIMGRHVLPNVLKQNIVYLGSALVFAVTTLTAFSFLGFGIQQPTPEWGSMISAGQPYLTIAPMLVAIPGAVITVFALGLSLLGDGVQDRLEKR